MPRNYLPANRTHRFAKPADTLWIERDDYTVCDTPNFRGTNYGHCLIIFENPARRGFLYWQARWQSEHTSKGVDRGVLCWECEPFAAPKAIPRPTRGVRLTCLKLHELQRSSHHMKESARAQQLSIRPVSTDLEWHQVKKLADLVYDKGEERYMAYHRWFYGGLRRRTQVNQGHWWGAFKGPELVGMLGLLHDGGEARFQNVMTHPQHRRQGIASKLIINSIDALQAELGPVPVYIAAEWGAEPHRLYKGLGFRRVSTLWEFSFPPDA